MGFFSASAFPRLDALKVVACDALAREALLHPRIEQAIVAACRRPALRKRTHLGAVAVAYTRVLSAPELRVADFGEYKLHVDVADVLGIGPYFFGDTRTSWVTPALVRAGDVCVDAGANVGHYTFHLASRVGPTGRVLAFEPNPRFVEMIRRSIASNGFERTVTVNSRALWSHSGETLTFYLSTNSANSGTSSVVNHGVFVDAEHTVNVETIALSDVADREGIERFALVKMDIERAEAQALQGMERLLAAQRVDALIVEMHAGSEGDVLLRRMGYETLLIDEEGKRLIPSDRVELGSFGDFLAMAPGKRGALEARIGALRGQNAGP